MAESSTTGAIFTRENKDWNWLDSNVNPDLDPVPWDGNSAHQSATLSGMHQHYFVNMPNQLVVNAGDMLVAYVYLDSLNPPRQVMLQWLDASG